MQDYTGTRTVSPLPWSSSTQFLTLSSYTLFVSSYQFSTRYSCTPSLSPSSPLPPLSSYSYSRLQASPFVFFKSKSLYHKHRHSGKRFPVRLEYVQQAITAYPTATKYIMMTIPSPVPCDYMFTVQYMAEHAMDYQPVDVRLRIGFIGHPGSVNWSSTWKCNSNSYYGSKKWVRMMHGEGAIMLNLLFLIASNCFSRSVLRAVTWLPAKNSLQWERKTTF